MLGGNYGCYGTCAALLLSHTTLRSFVNLRVIKRFHLNFHHRQIILFGFLGSHDPTAEEFADEAKSISVAMQFAMEEIVLVRRFHLSFSYCLDRGMLWRTYRAFRILISSVQTSLMERVLAKKVDDW